MDPKSKRGQKFFLARGLDVSMVSLPYAGDGLIGTLALSDKICGDQRAGTTDTCVTMEGNHSTLIKVLLDGLAKRCRLLDRWRLAIVNGQPK